MSAPWRFVAGNLEADGDAYHWRLNGVERRDRNDAIEVVASELVDLSATGVQQMYRRINRVLEYPPSDMYVRLGTMPPDQNTADLEHYPFSGVSFSFDDNNLVLVLQTFVELPERFQDEDDVVALISPLLQRKRLSLLDLVADGDGQGHWMLTFRLGFNSRGRSLFDLYSDALLVQALLEASSGDVSHQTVSELIRGGNAEALLGQPEGHWLEVKRQHADLMTDVGKIRLAQWVAQFANAPNGGVLVLGLVTKDQGSGDVITKVSPLPPLTGARRKYVQVIDTKVIPPIEDLQVEVVAHGDGELILIEVPPQSEENKPFLVHGAVVEGKAQGTFFSIVRRRNDEMASTHPANVHANLTVGRAFLRGNITPSPSASDTSI